MVEEGVHRIPLTKAPKTARHVARENGLVSATDGPADVPIKDYQDA